MCVKNFEKFSYYFIVELSSLNGVENELLDNPDDERTSFNLYLVRYDINFHQIFLSAKCKSVSLAFKEVQLHHVELAKILDILCALELHLSVNFEALFKHFLHNSYASTLNVDGFVDTQVGLCDCGF